MKTGVFRWSFLYKLLPTTSGPQKFSKIIGLKVAYFHLPSKQNIQNRKHEFIFMKSSFCIDKIKNVRQFSEKYFSKNGP